MDRNQCPESNGIGVRIAPEWVSGMPWNTHPFPNTPPAEITGPNFYLTIRNRWLIVLPVRKGVHVASLSTTRMSSKGQVVIPEEIRNRLGLASGTQFVVVGDRDVVILKALSAPSIKGFDDLILQARRQARKSGLKKADVDAALAKVRGRR